MRRYAVTAVAVLFGWGALGTGHAQVSVLTYHNDVARTGQNLDETILTPANVNQSQFGKLLSYNVDGYVVAQPLYLQNVSIANSGSHNVVYVATLHDSVYAFDADSVAANAPPLWQVSFVNPAMGITTVPASEAGCANVTKFTEHGIIGTPVIDPSSGTLYVIAKTKESGSYVQRLHALDVGTGEEKFGGPVVIAATVPGTGDGSTTVTFNALNQMQRPGLLLLNNTIYALFGANGCKQVHNHGWILAYDAQTLQQTGVFNTTPNQNNGGSWQAGSGPAVDSDGNIYFETADAIFDADSGGVDFGDSILKLTPGSNGLSLTDFFTPMTQAADNLNDLDLGSVGPLVLPDQPGPFPHLLIGSGKDETIYLLNRDDMGGYSPAQDQIVQEVPAAFSRQRDGVPTYWNGMVYFQQFGSPVAAYSLSNGLLSTAPVSQTSVIYQRNNPSSISASGNSSGILWMTTGNSTGTASTLRAFDPTNLATEFYDSDQAGTRDSLSLAAHWATPTIANGKVYVGTQTQLAVYGLTGVAPAATLDPPALNFANQNVGTTSSPQAITLTNTGNATLAVSSVVVNGANASDFEQTNDCTTNMAPGTHCTISVTFSPAAAGARGGAVVIADNAANSPQNVGLTGTGVTSQGPVVSLSPGSLGFGNQGVNGTSAINTSTLSNTGGAALAISSIASSGDFALATTATSCPYAGGSVNAGASCTIDVTFTPTQTGSRIGSIAVTDNASDSPEVVPLSGTGIQASTTVSLSASPNPSAFDQTVSLTATIVPQFGGQATGTVNFMDGAVLLGSAGVSGNVAPLNTSSLAVGSHTLTAVYAGDSNFAGSTSPGLSQVVNQAATSSALTVSPNPSMVGQQVQLTATVSGQFGGAPIGTVTFKGGVTLLGTSPVNDGQAILNFAFKTSGTRAVVAIYSGDANFLTSTSSPVQQTVNKVATSTVLTSDQNPSSFNQPVTFSATVSSDSGSPPDGEVVTFKDGALKVGTGTLSGGVAAFVTSTLKFGDHDISATYGGDAALAMSTSAALQQTVNQATTTTVLTTSPNPSIVNQSVQLTAAVSGQFGGTPAGTVKFMAGTTFLGKGTLSSGQASINFAFKTAGVRSITASYFGGTNFLASASAPVQQAVNKGATIVVLTSSQNPSSLNQSVTFTATVSSGQGNPPDGELVTFKSGTVKLGTGILSGGVATLATSALKRGAHNITAVYGGDIALAASTSAVLPQSVN